MKSLSAKETRIFSVSADSVLRYFVSRARLSLRGYEEPRFQPQTDLAPLRSFCVIRRDGFCGGARPGSQESAGPERPQIIYHLPPASNSAATLHSQAKGRNNDLPVDSSMPTSLQMSHTRANEAAEQQQTPLPSPSPPAVKTKVQSNSLRERPRSSTKSQGHRNSHGHKPGKN
jgi:hypothetical protein